MRKLALALVAVVGLASGCVVYDSPERYGNPHYGHPYRGGDRDRDGIPNRYDRDRDGDGVPNRYDRRPNDLYRY